MTFGLLGNLVEGGAILGHGAVTTLHRNTDDTLDRTGLSAFVPPAVHEVSDGALGLLQRGVLDVGQTSGAILRSFEQKPLHAHDKSIGGNLRKDSKSKQSKPKPKTNKSKHSKPKDSKSKGSGKRGRD